VDEHIGDPRVDLFDGVLDQMGDVVPFADGNAAVDPNVQVDVKRDSHFSHEAFLDVDHAGHRGSRFLDPRNDFATRRRIQHFPQRRK